MVMYDKRFMYEPGLRLPLIMKGPGIKPGITPREMVLNIDFAPTILQLAGVDVPSSMQGESVHEILNGKSPANWRKSIYYRYYHDPGHHNTRAHLGVRTETHKLIFYWKENQYELFDLTNDPNEQVNLLFQDGASQSNAGQSKNVGALFEQLKLELERLQARYQDDGAFADPASWPKDGVDGPFPEHKPLGPKTVAEAIGLSTPAGE
ncbi:MAG: DUF4976 domain-containing protein [Pirellula sp.]|nr:DUF4976 domain-containing protein [Pirellula sp.]